MHAGVICRRFETSSRDEVVSFRGMTMTGLASADGLPSRLPTAA
jgi:hypothetical protein